MKLNAARGWRFGNKDNFVITDENGAERFTSKGNVIKQQLFDPSGNLVGVLDSGLQVATASQVREYTIYVGGEKKGTYSRKEKIIGYEYEFVDIPWTFDRGEDKIKQGDTVIATLTDTASFFFHLISFAPRKYEADIPNEEDAVMAALISLGWHYFEAR
ncbi:MAG: hypothetical protein FWB71_00685 [Defluviitaleaceae bacterium]|nr:hypothetical protein [Defluviitaleaceae bacterium]